MRITTKGRYAVRAIVDIALRGEGKPVPIKTIAQSENLSPIFLEQIFTKLKRAGIVESIRGTAGGFRLVRSTEQISLLDILEAVEEGVRLTPCSSRDPDSCCREEDCSLNSFWWKLEDEIKDFLASQNISMIVGEYRDKNL